MEKQNNKTSETNKKIKSNKKVKKASQKREKPIEKKAELIKSLIFIPLALILFAYAGIISFTGKIFTNSFDNEKFIEAAEKATGFVIDSEGVTYSVKPNLHGIITVYNLKADWIGNQKLFAAEKIVIETNNPFCVFTKNFDINNMYFYDVFYADQHLADGRNKLYYFPGGFDSAPFGVEKIKVTPGEVKVKNFKITYTTPNSYDEKNLKEHVYTKQDVRTFLKSYNFRCLDIQ